MKNNNKIWTTKEVLQWTFNFFKENQIQSPQLNAEMILGKVLTCTRIELYLNFNKLLTRNEREEIKLLIKKRATHYPLQYLLGETEFYGNKFFVNEGVLIPRPETEILVDAIILYIKKTNKSKWKILDIGTGTGIIPISLSKYFAENKNELSLIATDFSEEALENSKKNIEFHNIQNIKLVQSNLFENIAEKFDIIISNPPYIQNDEMKNLSKEVKKFEPKSALLGGKNGLDFYNKILKNSGNYFNKNGKIFFEIGGNQKDKIIDLAKKLNFTIIDTIKDYNNFYRVLVLER